MSQAISINSTRLINFNYDFANCCVTIATMTIKQDLRTCKNKFLNCNQLFSRTVILVYALNVEMMMLDNRC